MASPDHSRHLVDEMNRYYDARAPWHDSYMSYTSAEALEQQLRPIIELIEKFLTGRRILEIACGTGNWTQVLASRANSVVAVDVSRSALEIARNKLGGARNVTFVQGDAYELAGIGESFEVLFAADWWSHIPLALLPSFLRSVSGKLVPRSKMIFTDMTFKLYFRQESCYYDSDRNRISRRRLPDGSEFEVVKNFPTEAEIRHLLADLAWTIDYREFPALDRWLLLLEGLSVDLSLSR